MLWLHALIDGVRRDVCVWDKDGEFDQPNCQGGKCIVGIFQGSQVDRSASLFVVWKSFTQENARETACYKTYKSNNADCPWVADSWSSVEDNQWENDSTNSTRSTCNPGS